MAKYSYKDWETNVGSVAEHTNQGYQFLFPNENSDPVGKQRYWDVLPSVHVKYGVHKNANLRFSYARAVKLAQFLRDCSI